MCCVDRLRSQPKADIPDVVTVCYRVRSGHSATIFVMSNSEGLLFFKADIEESASNVLISIEAGSPYVYKRSLSWRHEDRDAESI